MQKAAHFINLCGNYLSLPVFLLHENNVDLYLSFLFVQLKGQKTSRYGAQGPFGGLPHWALSPGPISLGSGLLTPMCSAHLV